MGGWSGCIYHTEGCVGGWYGTGDGVRTLQPASQPKFGFHGLVGGITPTCPTTEATIEAWKQQTLLPAGRKIIEREPRRPW